MPPQEVYIHPLLLVVACGSIPAPPVIPVPARSGRDTAVAAVAVPPPAATVSAGPMTLIRRRHSRMPVLRVSHGDSSGSSGVS